MPMVRPSRRMACASRRVESLNSCPAAGVQKNGCRAAAFGIESFRPERTLKFCDLAMGLLRILVDGYSLLHAWPEVAAGCPRHSAEARDELIRVLTNYGDMMETPVTVFFDGGGAPPGTPGVHSEPNMEVIYSPAGKTADDLIERVAGKLTRLGEVLVVTNDHAERDIVSAFGALARSCEEFILDANDALAQLSDTVKRYNQQERRRYKGGK